MNLKKSILTFTLFLCVFSLSSIAQTTTPNGKAQLIEFNNTTANFSVPDGKTWVIYNIFSDYTVDGVMKYNEYDKKNRYEGGLDIRIFLKDLNGVEKTNYVKNFFGTQLYRSTNASTVIPYPIIFPEKTTFNLIVLKGELGILQLHGGTGYISLIEVDN
jgi:hypothetical protein